MRIMSNNIWWCDENHEAWETQGADCSAKARAPQLVRLYKETLPDILGLQECSARMAHFLMTPMAQEGLPYALLWGRNTPIVYRRDKFELVDSEVGLYPEEVPGLEGSFNDLQTKSYCIAVLRSKEDPTSTMELAAVTLGSLAFVLAPYEMFSEQGKFIKKNVKMLALVKSI